MLRCASSNTVRLSDTSSLVDLVLSLLIAFCLSTLAVNAFSVSPRMASSLHQTVADGHLLSDGANRFTRTLKQLEPEFSREEHRIEQPVVTQRKDATVRNEKDSSLDAANNNVIYSSAHNQSTLPRKNITSYLSDEHKNLDVISRRLPHAIIIGVKKSGTRALLEFLRSHPDIRAPGPEIHFFDKFYDKGLDWYSSQLPPVTADEQLIVEKTPSYFVTPTAPSRVYNMSAATRLIVVVRDPVTRAVSDYTQAITKRPDIGSFERRAFSNGDRVDTSWGAIKIGLYAKYLEMWLRYFPLQQIHFVHGEKLISDPAGELVRVQDFLGLRPVITKAHFYFNTTKGFPCLRKLSDVNNGPHCLGKTKGRTHPAIDQSALRRLRQFYRPFNAKFYEMTGIDFGWS